MAQKTSLPEPTASRLASPGLTPLHGKKGLLSWKWAEYKLNKKRNFCIATVRKDGSPHVMIIWGLWLKRVMYFSTGPRSQKALNLERNPNCVICTDQGGKAVIIEAIARKLSVSELDENLISSYKRKYKVDPRSLGNAIYTARPSVIYGMDEKRGPRSSTRWVFRRD